MGRVSKVEACMICGEVPCACNKRAAKPAKKSKPTAAPQRPRTSAKFTPGMVATTRPDDAASGGPAPAIGQPLDAPKPDMTRSIEELACDEAIRTIHTILGLCKEDAEKYRAVFSSRMSTEERLRLWKWRVEHGVAS